ncbi:hypothetical protein [Thermococcus sp.]|uniref:hypothetical protein n=1 Tax=Thermococcus sp. TaxID=35749 RepID=UPI00260E3572|nr:hypothetical protein [Thermococcus sp.]
MRQKVVWFILGVLVGSLFVASAYPTNGSVRYGTPAIQRIPGENYTAYLLYPKNGLPLSPQFLKQTIPKLVEKSAPNAKWHVYAAPELPKGSVITGYGIKVTRDGRVDILITATNMNNLILPDRIRGELLEWSKKAPKFKPDVIPKEKIGVPKGWEVKTVDSNGNVKVYSGESSPYWHNFGRQELRYDDPPYGKLYAEFYMWGLWNDNNPQTETFACTKDRSGHGIYRVTPGILLKRQGISGYGNYRVRKIVITHDWGIEPALHGYLDDMGPVGIINNYQTIPINIGPISYPLAVGGYKVYGDAIDPPAMWTIDTLGTDGLYTETSEHTVGIMVASSGEVQENVLHDGRWHAVVRVSLSAEFSDNERATPTGVHQEGTSLTWYVKVG